MSSIYDMDEDDAESSSNCLAALKFPDDFAEFQARADSGGSTYGVLKRHAFAQQSLRVVAPSDPDVDVIVPQRRANSLVPPVVSLPYTEASGDDGAAVANQKMIIAVLCDQPPQQQRRHRYHHHHQHAHSDMELSDDDRSDRIHQRHRLKSDLSLNLDRDKGYHHHHHHHKHHRNQSSNQQHQHSKQPAVKMDTLQVKAHSF